MIKKFLLPLFFIGAIAIGANAQGNYSKDIKNAKQELKRKALKDARKEAKRLSKKEDYRVNAGALPMEKQLERSMVLTLITNDKGQQKYYSASQVAKAETFAAAKQQALQLALNDIASQIGSNIIGRIKSNVANAESLKDATSVTEVIGAYQNTVAAKLGRVDPVIVIHKIDKKSSLTKVQVRVFYDIADAERKVKTDIRKELKAKTKELQDEIDEILELD